MPVINGKNKYSNIKSKENKYSQWELSTPSRTGFGLCTVFFVTVAKNLINIYYFLVTFVSFLYLFPCFLPGTIFFAMYSASAVYSGVCSCLYHLQGLKKNWEEVHKEFQSLSVFIDSIPKKMRKQKLEEEMKQLEHDIAVLEKHKIIYIANKK